MTLGPSIELINLGKMYPRNLSAQLSSVLMAAIGRPSETVSGGVALANLTLSIHKGERVGIIGRNGAGKSTLLQILAGITDPSTGQLRISGKVTAVLTLGIGLREDLTGRENIYLDGETQGKTREEIKDDMDAIIDFAEIGKFADLPLHTYSTGMKSRLAFSMITQIKPEILIIDEALSVGDAAFSIKAGKRISQLCSEGAIVLIVSHSMQSIRELCNRCLWLDAGNLLMDGTPDYVTNAYLTSVSEKSQNEHLHRFKRLIGTKSFIPQFILDELSLSSNGQFLNQINSGDPLRIKCNWHMLEPRSLGKFSLRCIRLDGALICEHNIPITSATQKNIFQVLYPRFNLAPGFYIIKLEWIGSHNEKRAESNAILEIVANNLQTGGRPVLADVGTIQGIEVKRKI